MIEKNMVTLEEITVMKSRSGVYSDTSENRRKHRVGQKYGVEKQPEDGKKAEKKKTDPAQELEAVNKVISAINEGKLNLPASEVITLLEKKQKLEAAMKQVEKVNSGVKANEEKKNAKEAKETSKKITETQKKETEKKSYKETKSEPVVKQYASMDIKEANKELVGKKITFKEYFADGTGSYKDGEGEIKEVRLYGKEKKPIAEIDFPNGDSASISLEQLDKREAVGYKILFDEHKQEKGEKPKEEKEPEVKSEEKEILNEDGEPVTITHDKDKFDRYSLLLDFRRAKAKLGFSYNLSKQGYLKQSGFLSEKGKKKYLELKKEFGDKKYIFREKIQKQEPKQGGDKNIGSYAFIKFDEIPNSGKINLKKYLSDKVRKGVDEKWSNIKNISTANLKTMKDGLVNDLNKNFETLKKSQRAELLYSIMKVKGELISRKNRWNQTEGIREL